MYRSFITKETTQDISLHRYDRKCDSQKSRNAHYNMTFGHHTGTLFLMVIHSKQHLNSFTSHAFYINRIIFNAVMYFSVPVSSVQIQTHSKYVYTQKNLMH